MKRLYEHVSKVFGTNRVISFKFELEMEIGEQIGTARLLDVATVEEEPRGVVSPPPLQLSRIWFRNKVVNSLCAVIYVELDGGLTVLGTGRPDDYNMYKPQVDDHVVLVKEEEEKELKGYKVYQVAWKDSLEDDPDKWPDGFNWAIKLKPVVNDRVLADLIVDYRRSPSGGLLKNG